MGIKVVPVSKEPKKKKKQKGVKDMRAWVLNQLEKEGVTANLNAPTGSLLDVLEATRDVSKDARTDARYLKSLHGNDSALTKQQRQNLGVAAKQVKAIGGPVGYTERWKTGRKG